MRLELHPRSGYQLLPGKAQILSNLVHESLEHKRAQKALGALRCAAKFCREEPCSTLEPQPALDKTVLLKQDIEKWSR